ncbi:MAG TPA: SDR family NAD(P)-dependent oxidoreductase [Allosphingosinicella sp.]|jgi:serine 3-dehydrogenase
MSGTIFITGATAGIGAAAARRFAGAGWKVIATGRRRDRLDSLVAELGPERVHPVVLDITDHDAVDAALAALPAPFAGIDLLLNNAGLAPPMAPLHETELGALRRAIDTNIVALVALTRKLLPGLIARRGAIVNLSSVAATYPYRGGAVYGGSKAFVSQFTLNLRSDLHGTGVRVTAIEPGLVKTEFTIVRTGGDVAASEALYRGIDPMTAEDIADTIFWVASQPPHININSIELMPVTQSFAGFTVARED